MWLDLLVLPLVHGQYGLINRCCARPAVGHDTGETSTPTSPWSRPSVTASATAARSPRWCPSPPAPLRPPRDEPRPHASVRHHQRRLRHNTIGAPPQAGPATGYTPTPCPTSRPTRSPATGRVRANGDQPHHPHPHRTQRDTLHAQPRQRQQRRRIRHYRVPRPRGLLPLLQNTARIRRPRATSPQARRGALPDQDRRVTQVLASEGSNTSASKQVRLPVWQAAPC